MFLFGFSLNSFGQCITVTPVGSRTVTACPGRTVTLTPTVTLSGSPTGVSYSWAGTGGVICTPANAPSTHFTMPNTPQSATFSVTATCNLICNGNFDNGMSCWNSDYSLGCGGPSWIQVTNHSDDCGHNDCLPPFGDYNTGTGNMLTVDGSKNGTGRFLYQYISGSGYGNYIFECRVRSVANNRHLGFLVDERPIIRVKIGASKILMLTMNPGCSGWQPISDNSNYTINPSDIITFEDLRNTGKDLHNEFVIDDIKLTHTGTTTLTYTLQPNPVPSVTFNVSPSPICCGSPWSITANTSNCGTGCTYSWIPTSYSPSTAATVTHAAVPCSSITAPTPVMATVDITNSFGCKIQAVNTHTIMPTPTSGVITGPDKLCLGAIQTYTTTGNALGTWGPSFIGNHVHTYGFGGAITGTFIAASVGSTTITYAAPDNGCGTPTPALFSVTVLPLPTASCPVSFLPVMCPGDLTIPLHGTPGATVYYYVRRPSDLFLSTLLSTTLDASGDGHLYYPGLTEGTFHLYLSSVSDGFCSSPIKQTIDITVKKPTGIITASTKPCVGQPFTLTLVGPSGGSVTIQGVSPTTGSWTVPIPSGAAITNTTTLLITPVPTGAGPFSYQVTSATGYGCTNNDAGPTFTITPNPNPAVTITPAFSVCAGQAFSIQSNCTSTCPSSVILQHISTLGGSYPDVTLPYHTGTPSYTYNSSSATSSDAGIYTIVASSGSCTVTASTTITVNRNPTVFPSVDQTCDWEGITYLHFNGTPYSTVHYQVLYDGVIEPPADRTAIIPGSGSYVLAVSAQSHLSYTVTSITSAFTGCSSYGPWPSVSNAASYFPETVPVYLGGTAWEIFCPGYTAGHCLTATYRYDYQDFGTGPDFITGGPYTCTISNVHTPMPPIPIGTNLITILSITDCARGCTAGTERSVAIPVIAGRAYPAIASRPGQCSNSSTGAPQAFVAVRPSGVPPAIAYQWFKSTAGSGFSPIALATDSIYTYSPSDTDQLYFTVTDTIGTDTSSIFTVHIYPYPSVHTLTDSVTVCEGDSVIFMLVSPDDATTYTWSGGDIACLGTDCHQAIAHPLVSGNISVQATNSAGCTSSHSVYVNALASPPLLLAADNVDICAGDVVHMHVVDADPTLTYQWSGDPSCIGVLCDSVVDTIGVTTTYTVTSTATSGCRRTATITINVHSQPVVVSASATTLCGAGSALLSIVSPDPNVFYTWSGDYTTCTNSLCTEAVATVVGSTIYTVTALDAFGCSARATQSIAVYPVPSVTAVSSINAICAGSSVTLSMPDYDPSLTYTWSGGGVSCISSSCNIATDVPVNNTVYTVTATNTFGCRATSTVAVNMSLPLSVPVPSLSVCPGAAVSLSVIDPVGFIVYSWSGGDVTCVAEDCTSAIAHPGSNTVYTVTANSLIDGACSATATVAVTIYSSTPVTLAATAAVCAGNVATLSVVSPVSGTTYSWAGGTISCTSANCYSAVDYPLTATVYTVIATDINGCTNIATQTVEMSTPVSASASSTVACVGQIVTLHADHPVAGYTYSWSGFGESDSVIDNSGDTLIHIRVFNSGTYTLTATSGGCSAVDVISVNVHHVKVAGSIDKNTVCSGSAVAMSVVNPTSLYTYSWSGGGVACSDPDCYTATDHPVVNTGYVLTATDSAGCSDTAQLAVLMNVPLAIAVANANVCAGQVASAHIVDPIMSVTYWWGPSSGSYACMNAYCDSINISADTTTTYTVIATDTLGCSQTDTFTIHVIPLPVVASGVSATLVCNGATITLSVMSPDPAYSYSWSGGVSCTDGSCYTATAVVAGYSTFMVTATDASGCTGTSSVAINTFGTPNAPVAAQEVVCSGSSDILYVPSPSGTYAWYGNTTVSCINATCDSISVTPADTGYYYYVVVDTNGCHDTSGIAVPTYPLPVILAGGSVTICSGTSATLTASGGVSYSWSPGGSSANPFVVTPANTTTYSVVGTDIHGCGNTAVVTVNIPSMSISGNRVICQGAATTLTASGAVTYSWTPSAGLSSTTKAAPSVAPSVTTTYTVTGTTSGGCVISNTVTVTVNTASSYSVAVAESAPFYLYDPEIGAYTYCGVSYPLELKASGTIPAPTYIWTPSLTSYGDGNQYAAPAPTATTNYTVSATYGCTYKAVVKVVVASTDCTPCDAFRVMSQNTSLSAPTGYSTDGIDKVQPFHTIIGTTMTATTGSTSVPATNNIYVGNTITLSSGTYSNKVICVGKDLGLRVSSSSDVVLDACHIFSQGTCTWSGIRVFPGATSGTLEVKNNTLIENTGNYNTSNAGSGAVYVYAPAINVSGPSSGPVINSHGAIYNNNYYGIYVNGYYNSGTVAEYPFSITDNIFTTANFKNYNDGVTAGSAHYYPFSWPANDYLGQSSLTTTNSGLSNLATFTTGITQYGTAIQATNCISTSATGSTPYSSIVVGGTSEGTGNVFANLNKGISFSKTSLKAYRNVFDNLLVSSIVMDANNDNTVHYQAQIGGSAENANNFYMSPVAFSTTNVSGSGIYNILFSYNVIQSSLTSTTYGASINATSYDNIDISHNTITGVKNPIKIISATSSTVSWSHGELHADNNILNSANGIAIDIEENPVATSADNQNGNVTACGNRCTDVYNGIYVYNFKYMPVKTSNNQVKIAQAASGTQFGIRYRSNRALSATSSMPAEIIYNKIVGPGYATPVMTGGDGGGLINTSTHIDGIHMYTGGSSTYSVLVANNYVNEVNVGFRFEQINYAKWKKNVMENNTFGYVLAVNSTGPSVKGTIGLQDECEPSDNQWLETAGSGFHWNNTTNFQTAVGTLNPATTSPTSILYVRNTPECKPVYNKAYSSSWGTGVAYGTGSLIDLCSGTPCSIIDNCTVTPTREDPNADGTSGWGAKPGEDNKLMGKAPTVDYQLYPNPTNGKVLIKRQSGNNDPIVVKIYNTLGSVVYNNVLTFNAATAEIPALNVTSGIYIVEITSSDNQRFTTRLVIQN